MQRLLAVLAISAGPAVACYPKLEGIARRDGYHAHESKSHKKRYSDDVPVILPDAWREAGGNDELLSVQLHVVGLADKYPGEPYMEILVGKTKNMKIKDVQNEIFKGKFVSPPREDGFMFTFDAVGPRVTKEEYLADLVDYDLNSKDAEICFFTVGSCDGGGGCGKDLNPYNKAPRSIYAVLAKKAEDPEEYYDYYYYAEDPVYFAAEEPKATSGSDTSRLAILLPFALAALLAGSYVFRKRGIKTIPRKSRYGSGESDVLLCDA